MEYADKIKDTDVYKAVIPNVVDIFMQQERFEELKNLYIEKNKISEEYKSLFLASFEQYYLNMSSENKIIWLKLYVNQKDNYGLLSRCRVFDELKDNILSDKTISEIYSLEWDELYPCYGDLLWILIKNGKSITPCIKNLSEKKLNVFFEYLCKNKKQFGSVFLNYLQRKEFQDNNQLTNDFLHLKVCILRNVLIFGEVSDNEYKKLFNSYVESGIQHLRYVYNQNIIDNDQVSCLKTNEDAFLLYMKKALEYYEIDKVKYVRYLRLALKQDNYMKKGIDVLQKEIDEKIIEPKKELERHKKSIIRTIEDNINSGNINIAKALIKEYENIVGSDAKLCCLKGITFAVDKKLDEAKEIFLKGLKIEPNNSDLIYNMKYLNEISADQP